MITPWNLIAFLRNEKQNTGIGKMHFGINPE
jgi:hypothetical protein